MCCVFCSLRRRPCGLRSWTAVSFDPSDCSAVLEISDITIITITALRYAGERCLKEDHQDSGDMGVSCEWDVISMRTCKDEEFGLLYYSVCCFGDSESKVKKDCFQV